MTKRARVVISTVGPYALYGTPLVEACIRNNCDYVDLTGEAVWIRQLLSRHLHEAAAKKGVAIVHSCGFDSVPSDIGALFVVEYLRERHGVGAAQVLGVAGVETKGGGASGGTIASMLNLFSATDKRELKASMRPDSLVPADAAKRPAERDTRWPRFEPLHGGWVMPWLMESFNSRIVRRSEALRGDYGARFSYTEPMAAGSALVAYLGTLFMGLAVLLLALAPTRWLLVRTLLPEPGQGPSRQTIESSRWGLKLVAVSEAPASGKSARVVEALVRGKRDPGYGCTSRMLSECALALLDRDSCAVGARGGGLLTPAAAIGLPLVERLKRADVTFEIVSDQARN